MLYCTTVHAYKRGLAYIKNGGPFAFSLEIFTVVFLGADKYVHNILAKFVMCPCPVAN